MKPFCRHCDNRSDVVLGIGKYYCQEHWDQIVKEHLLNYNQGERSQEIVSPVPAVKVMRLEE